jgi:hypothetical protein
MHAGTTDQQRGDEAGLNAIDGDTVLSLCKSTAPYFTVVPASCISYKELDHNNDLVFTGPDKYQSHVKKVIRDLTPQQVLDLGQELGLYYSTLKRMPQESVHGDMVHAWLMKMDDVPEVGGDPTWQSFARGLAEQRLWGAMDIVRNSEWGYRNVSL